MIRRLIAVAVLVVGGFAAAAPASDAEELCPRLILPKPFSFRYEPQCLHMPQSIDEIIDRLLDQLLASHPGVA